MIIRRSVHNTYYSHGSIVTRLRNRVEKLEYALHSTTGIVVDTDSIYIKMFHSVPGNTSWLKSRVADDIRRGYHNLKHRGSTSAW